MHSGEDMVVGLGWDEVYLSSNALKGYSKTYLISLHLDDLLWIEVEY